MPVRVPSSDQLGRRPVEGRANGAGSKAADAPAVVRDGADASGRHSCAAKGAGATFTD